MIRKTRINWSDVVEIAPRWICDDGVAQRKVIQCFQMLRSGQVGNSKKNEVRSSKILNRRVTFNSAHVLDN